MKLHYSSLLVWPVVILSAYLLYQHHYDQQALRNLMYKLKDEVNSCNVSAALAQEATAAPAVEGEVAVSKRWSALQPKLKDTVVQVWTQAIDFNWIEPYKAPQQGMGVGSGFFIDSQGTVVTNFHVVNGAIAVELQIPSMGKQRLSVDIIGVNPDRDLAILRLKPEDLLLVQESLGCVPYLTIGNSDTVRRSDEIMTLGYPLGQQSLKSTTGVVSGQEHIEGRFMIQISAPINPGNSGGPSINQDGQVIGINTASIAPAQNVNYIIPSNEVTQFIKHLDQVPVPDDKACKFLRKPVLGIFFNTSSDTLTAFLKNPIPAGLYVADCYKGGPLDKAGVRPGDMVYEIDGHRLDCYGEMNVRWSEDKISIVDYVSRLMLGDTINLLVYRNGKPLQMEFVFEQCALASIRQKFPGYEKIDFEVFGGMVLMDLTLNHIQQLLQSAPQLATYLDFKKQIEPAVVITHALPDSCAYRTRLPLRGWVLQEVNGIPVKTLDDVRKAVRKHASSDFLTIKTTDNLFFAMPMKKVIEEENRIARTFSYSVTPFMKDIIAQEYKRSSEKKS